MQKDKSLFGGSRGDKEKGAPARANPDKEIEAEIDQIEKDLNELRSAYELYFMGVEKLEPAAQRDVLKATLRRWQELKPRNTALKFRIQQMKARLVSLENYWQRITRQREEGTYNRDLAKVKRRDAERALKELAAQKKAAPESTNDLRAPMSSADGRSVPSAALQPGRSRDAGSSALPRGASDPQAMARPRASSADDLTEPKLRKLYETYVSARKRCGEGVDLRYEDMAAALRKQVPRLISETGARSVEFKVVIRSGKTVLKALPKHE